MSPLTTDNRDMVEIETELRARVEAQRSAIERLERDNARLVEENCELRSLLEHSEASARATRDHLPGLRPAVLAELN
jgi:predicted nuclease with TOPRIM domain